MKTRSFLRKFALVLMGAVVVLTGHGLSPSARAAIVGYVNVPVPQGLALIANPLQGSPDDNANTIMPTAPEGTAIHRYDAASQTYLEPVNWFSGVGWRTLSGNPADPILVIAPGEGFWVESPQAWTNTFVGQVMTGTNINPILAYYNLKADLVPAAGLLQTSLGFPARPGDEVYLWSSPASSHASFDTAWAPSEPTLAVAQGFFVWRNPAEAIPANYWRTVLNPFFSPPKSSLDIVDRPADPVIQRITIKDGEVSLDIRNPSAARYRLLFSADGVSWRTIAADAKASVAKTGYPAGARGYYRVVKQ